MTRLPEGQDRQEPVPDEAGPGGAPGVPRQGRARRWGRLVVGLLLVVLGIFLLFRPFSSLAVLLVTVVVALAAAGVSALVRREPGAARWQVAAGVTYLLAAAVVLLWPGATIRVLTVAVAVALLVDGVADVMAARRVHGTARFNGVLGGAVSGALGVLALVWPDVTLLVVAVVFGAKLVTAGVRQVIAAFRDDDAPLVRRRGVGTSASGGWARVTGTVVGAVVTAVLVLVSLALQRSAPTPDAFYDAPAALDGKPGQLLRSEPFTSSEIPSGAKAWRILYTTTNDAGRTAPASGLVIAPASAVTGSGSPTPSPVIAWAHGTTGFTPGCAPSVLPTGLSAGAMMLQDKVIAEGWALVATDYIGLGTPGPHPYLIGPGEGRSVLDAVRASHQLKDVQLADDTVVWGHSQGGHAALWTGVLAPTYAPDLKVDGVAALAPASNLPGLIQNLGNVTGGQLFASYVIAAYTQTYPDVKESEYVRPGARIITEEMAQRCLAEKSTLVSVLSALFLDKPIWQGEPDRGSFHQRLVENIPSGPIPAPLLIGQGAADSLVIPTAQQDYVKARCDAGYAVDYRTYAGRDHVPLVEPDSPLVPELLAWTHDRFDGKAARDTCRR